MARHRPSVRPRADAFRAPERLPRIAASAALTALAALGCAAAPHSAWAAGGTPVVPADLLAPALPGRLSDEQTFTRWTTALRPAPARTRPDPSARTVAKLRYHTEDRLPEVYVGLEQAEGTDGRPWVRVRIPTRPNGTTAWVRASALNAWRVSRDLLWVDRRHQTAELRRGGVVVWRSRVGVGAPATPTPTGSFYVRERVRNLAGDPVYGPVAFGTSAYSRLSDWPGGGVVGIHGTDRPQLLPGRVSHGCVRVPNADVRRLARLLRVGTPVRIADGAYVAPAAPDRAPEVPR